MTDRELLILAAKAAGYNAFNYHTEQMVDGDWNPLSNDGDALRLAVKLQMLIDQCNSYVTTCSAVGGFAEAHEDTRDDPYAATRRAIVRVAADIGEKL